MCKHNNVKICERHGVCTTSDLGSLNENRENYDDMSRNTQNIGLPFLTFEPRVMTFKNNECIVLIFQGKVIKNKKLKNKQNLGMKYVWIDICTDNYLFQDSLHFTFTDYSIFNFKQNICIFAGIDGLSVCVCVCVCAHISFGMLSMFVFVLSPKPPTHLPTNSQHPPPHV